MNDFTLSANAPERIIIYDENSEIVWQGPTAEYGELLSRVQSGELLTRAGWEATMANEDGVTDHPLLYDDDGHVPHELEQRVAEAIKRYPNMDADWWLGPVAAIRAVSDWLLDAERGIGDNNG